MTVSRRPRDPGLDEDLWRRHRDELLRFATALVGPNDAHDVVADAFIRCTKAIGSVDVAKRRAYLYRAVSNQATSHHRASGRRWRRELATVVASAVPAPENFHDVRTAVMRLSVRQRAVVYFVYWQGAPITEAAATLGLSVSSARQHLERAHGQLRKALHG
jgi:RNA polymerase sigma-70 factor (ECF subfamily)